MFPQPVIAIFDIGKTNKKVFLFTEQYEQVFEESVILPETVDDDGERCEDLDAVQQFVASALEKLMRSTDFSIRAVNFSAYGASFVHLGQDGKPVAPLYNYLKRYPRNLLEPFYTAYGGETSFSQATASPVLGHLNAGLQLYWLKKIKPLVFDAIKYSLHLPQYLSYLVTSKPFSEPTSIGCHTALWNFSTCDYHRWVSAEAVAPKLAPIVPSTHAESVQYGGKNIIAGVGLHDSSAALIPYLSQFAQPFLLLSTGTWCITLNPFSRAPLTAPELQHDCLCYISYKGEPVKASRLFAGNEHERQVRRLSSYFQKPPGYFQAVALDAALFKEVPSAGNEERDQLSLFARRDLSAFDSFEAAYHQLIADLVAAQVEAINRVVDGVPAKSLFVDGGFCRNQLFMYRLAAHFPSMAVYAAAVPQASAIGAAMAMHKSWNSRPLPESIVQLTRIGT